MRNECAALSSCGFVTCSSAMKSIFGQAKEASNLNSSVLICGETGTGKEILAQAIHRLGYRRLRPFVAVDCSAVCASLFESEMFGCEKGAYTGAEVKRIGLFEAASGGTLFLDEIGNLELGLQCKLLRTIQQRQVRPVGSNHWVPVRVRIVAATSCDLDAALKKGTFRQDLYFRLCVIRFDLPPLRSRKEDVQLLVHYFVEKYSEEMGVRKSVSPEALHRLLSHSWPGNVRELQNVVQSAVALEEGSILEFRDFVPDGAQHSDKPEIQYLEELQTLAGAERHAFFKALQLSGGNKLEACRMLGIGKTTLYRKLHIYGVQNFQNRIGDAADKHPEIKVATAS